VRRLIHSADDLRDLAESGTVPLEVLERDLLLVTIAGKLAEGFPGDLCFKGGFVMRHVHGQQRMSKDVDATRILQPKHKLDSTQVAKVITSSARDLYTVRVSTPATDSGTSLDFDRVNYQGPCGGKGQVAVELSYREDVVLQPDLARIGPPFYEEFEIPVLQPLEIIAEKLRAIAQRLRPTDLSDVAFLLLERKVEPDRDVMRRLVGEKFRLVGGNHLERVRHNIGRLEREYEASVRAVAPDAADYGAAANAVLRHLDGWFA
jgi:predicted nucleotidyltransferase component of viral defense system